MAFTQYPLKYDLVVESFDGTVNSFKILLEWFIKNSNQLTFEQLEKVLWSLIAIDSNLGIELEYFSFLGITIWREGIEDKKSFEEIDYSNYINFKNQHFKRFKIEGEEMIRNASIDISEFILKKVNKL